MILRPEIGVRILGTVDDGRLRIVKQLSVYIASHALEGNAEGLAAAHERLVIDILRRGGKRDAAQAYAAAERLIVDPKQAFRQFNNGQVRTVLERVGRNLIHAAVKNDAGQIHMAAERVLADPRHVVRDRERYILGRDLRQLQLQTHLPLLDIAQGIIFSRLPEAVVSAQRLRRAGLTVRVEDHIGAHAKVGNGFHRCGKVQLLQAGAVIKRAVPDEGEVLGHVEFPQADTVGEKAIGHRGQAGGKTHADKRRTIGERHSFDFGHAVRQPYADNAGASGKGTDALRALLDDNTDRTGAFFQGFGDPLRFPEQKRRREYVF